MYLQCIILNHQKKQEKTDRRKYERKRRKINELHKNTNNIYHYHSFKVLILLFFQPFYS
jgi:hypothetical protein